MFESELLRFVILNTNSITDINSNRDSSSSSSSRFKRSRPEAAVEVLPRSAHGRLGLARGHLPALVDSTRDGSSSMLISLAVSQPRCRNPHCLLWRHRVVATHLQPALLQPRVTSAALRLRVAKRRCGATPRCAANVRCEPGF